MNRLLIPLLAAIALPTDANAGCLFGRCSSYWEAEIDCKEWIKKGPSKDYSIKRWHYEITDYKSYEETVYLRSCFHEERTRQILGSETETGIDELAKKCQEKNAFGSYCLSRYGGIKSQVKAHFRY